MVLLIFLGKLTRMSYFKSHNCLGEGNATESASAQYHDIFISSIKDLN